MAFAINTYTGNGSLTSFSISFPYIEQAHVIVTVGGVTKTLGSDYSFSNASTIAFGSAPANGAVIKFTRSTNRNARLVDYQDGSTITEAILDQDGNQSFFMAQEAIDITENTIGLTSNDEWDADNKKIINVTDPTAAQSAATKNYVDTKLAADINTVNTYKTAAETAKTAAETAETNAETAEANAVTAKNAAVVAQTAAETALDTFDDRFLGAKSSNPSVDNDGNALIDGALYFDTTNDLMKVYNLANTTWYQLALTGTNQTNVNTVAGQISPTNNISSVAGKATEIGLLGTSSNVTAMGLLGTSAVVTDMDLLGTSSNVTAMGTLGTSTNVTNMATLAGVSNLNNLANAHAAVTNVNNNLTSVNNFADVYRISATAPTTSLTDGDMWFDTTADKLKIWNGSSWDLAGSSVNGTSARFKYVATANQTTFTGADANGETLAYDSGYIDAYLNGVHLDPSDYTATDGSNFVLASGASVNDELYIVAFGTFSVSSIAGSAIDSGTINVARLPSTVLNSNIDLTNLSGTNITSGTVPNARLTGSGAITINGSAVSLGGAVTVGETKPTITSTSLVILPTTATSVTIAGTNFASSSTVLPIVEAVTSGGVLTRASVVSWSSATSISATFNLAQGDYRIRVENPDGNAVISANAILQVTPAPTWTTSAGNISTIAGGASIGTLSVVASSDSAVTYAKTSGTLPNGISINSSGVFSGTESGSTATTVYSFDVTTTDAEAQTAVRTFTITISHGATGGGQFN